MFFEQEDAPLATLPKGALTPNLDLFFGIVILRHDMDRSPLQADPTPVTEATR